MAKATDITVVILKEIRDEIKEVRGEVRKTNERVDALSARLDEVSESLGRRIVESELRTATAIAELAGTVRDLTGFLRAQGDLRPRVERCEQDIAELRRALPKAS